MWPFSKRDTTVQTQPVRYKSLQYAQDSYFRSITDQDGFITPEQMYKAGYKTCATVYACIERRRDAIRALDWKAYLESRDERREATDTSSIAKFIRRPNPNDSLASLLADVVGYLDITGNAYLNIVAGDAANRGTPRELWTIRPDSVTVIPSAIRGEVERYEVRNKGDVTEYQPWEFAHFKRWDPEDGLYGMSPLVAAGLAVMQNNQSQKSNLNIVKNNFSVPAWVESENSLSDDQFDGITKQLSQWIGVNKINRIPVLEAGLSLKPWAVSLHEMQWIEGLNITEVEIAKVYGVPPAMIQEDPTYSNAKESRRAFYEHTIIPLATQIADTLTANIASRFGSDYVIDFDRDAIEAIQEDIEAKRTFALGGWNAGLLTRNEALTMVGLDSREDDGEVYRESLNTLIVPADQVRTIMPEESEKSAEPGRLYRMIVGNDRIQYASTEQEQRELLRRVEELRAALLPSATRIVSDAFTRELDAIERAISLGSTPTDALNAVEGAIRVTSPVWDAALLRIYTVAADEFGELTAAQLIPEVTGAELVPYRDQWQRKVAQYVNTVGTEKIRGINETTRRHIRTQLLEGIQNGEGVDKLMNRVREQYEGVFSKTRAETIARTETMQASNAASYYANDSCGLPTQKEWLYGYDGRTRDGINSEFDHTHVSGPIPATEPFIVSGERMMFPGDGSMGASAGNVVNCRCTAAYTVVRE